MEGDGSSTMSITTFSSSPGVRPLPHYLLSLPPHLTNDGRTSPLVTGSTSSHLKIRRTESLLSSK
ncbi:UNVERIFIED_CONTAM: hypothetical protein Slati_1919300 [Sesamum latifolium]|uniref:Uncharacterized protein n=1 Tax=Sesamum latifolium TaxID=2727402 RepID=A0AAW2X3P8_9LAMI